MSYGKWFHPMDCEPGVGISGVDTGRPYFTWVLYVTKNILSTNTINKFLSRKFPLNPFIFICMHYRALVSVACTCGHQRAPCVHLRAFACTCGHLRALAGISVHQRAPRVQSRALSVQWRARDTCVTRTLSRMTSVSTVSRCPAGRRFISIFQHDIIGLLYAILHNTGSRGVACVMNWLERRGTSVKFTRFAIAAKT